MEDKKEEDFTKSVTSYNWGNRADDVAYVAWELTVLEMSMTDDYLNTVISVIANLYMNNQSNVNNTSQELKDIQNDVYKILLEASEEVGPLIHEAWEEIVRFLTEKCCVPLLAVKGVVATYSMTDCPPPKQVSPFVSTILRPIQ